MSAAMKCDCERFCTTVFGNGLWFALLLWEARRPSVSFRLAASSAFYTPHLFQPPHPSEAFYWPSLVNAPPDLSSDGFIRFNFLALLLFYGGHAHLDSHFSQFFSPSSFLCHGTNLLLFYPPSSPPPDCHACYHRSCFRPGKSCPRCERLAARRERMARRNMEEAEDEGGRT